MGIFTDMKIFSYILTYQTLKNISEKVYTQIYTLGKLWVVEL